MSQIPPPEQPVPRGSAGDVAKLLVIAAIAIESLQDLDDLNTQFVDRMIVAINNGEDVQQPPLVDELNTPIDEIETLQASIDFDALVACEDAVA